MCFLFQNPPTIPSLAVVWFVCLVRGSALVTDWHNYGFTILGLALGNVHSLVKFSKWYVFDFDFCLFALSLIEAVCLSIERILSMHVIASPIQV